MPVVSRRELMRGALAAGASSTLLATRRNCQGAGAPGREAGEGVVDTTPPLGIEMGGFHRPPGQERRIERSCSAFTA